jgi:hypothetical protein
VTAEYLSKLAADSTGQQVFFINPSQNILLERIGSYFRLQSPEFDYGDVGTAYQLWLYKAQTIRSD